MVRRQDTPRFKNDQAIRRNQVAALYVLKMNQNAIVEALNRQGIAISQATVSRDIQAITEDWKKESVGELDNMKVRELAGLDRLELEANSNLQQVKGRESKAELVKLIETILKIQERRSKLMGLDTPEKIDMKAEHSGQITVNLVRTTCRKSPGITESKEKD